VSAAFFSFADVKSNERALPKERRASEEGKMSSRRYQARGARAFLAALVTFVMLALPLSALAEGTHIKAPSNGYSPQDDVKVGLQAAQEAEQQLPILRDSEIEGYVNDVGQRLVRAIPEEYQHPEFRYTFRVVNQKEINAFALPGGPMYVNRGMIEAARNEGEMAGVMAHELSHVALRHGTAQATKAQKYSILGGAGAILGAIIGGGVGSIIGQGSQTAVGVYFLKFSREYETQADVLGSQIMARAGYDPLDLANMFRTIQQQGGGGGPQFLSDHPNPANRYQRIQQEAQLIGMVRNPIKNTPEFARVQSRLRGGGAYQTETGRNQYPTNNYPSQRTGNVPRPSTRFRQIRTDWYTMSIPDNWQDYGAQSSATFAPPGAADQNGITHGVIIGVDQEQSRDLRSATDQYLSEMLQGNPYLQQQSGYQSTSISGRTAYAMTLVGRSPVTGRMEQVTVVTTMLRDGRLFYFDAVAPQDEAGYYRNTFNNILRSIQFYNL
jgi:Zn-dependent protease with chaperone function